MLEAEGRLGRSGYRNESTLTMDLEVQASNTFLLALIFRSEVGGSAFFRSVGEIQPDRTTVVRIEP
jgi:hypothetical protein